MGNDWILDVLADLKTFAQQNGLSALTVQLEETVQVAREEVARERGAAVLTVGNAGTPGIIHRAHGGGRNA